MKVSKSQIAPFFQTIALTTKSKTPFKDILIEADQHFTKINKKGDHFLKWESITTNSKYLSIRHYVHKFQPTWLIKPPKISSQNSISDLECKTNEILILYQKEGFIFLHTSSTYLERNLSEIIKNSVPNVRLLNLLKLFSLANKNFLEFRTLGITNVFNAGGTAPEAKAFFGRNAEYSLSSALDAGYGLGYGLGARQDKKKSRPFGISTKKRKIWSTWTTNIDGFTKECDRLVKDLKSSVKNSKLQVLVSPIEIQKASQLNIFHIYIDYSIPKKGLLRLKIPGSTEYTLNWHAQLSDSTPASLIIWDEDTSKYCEIEMRNEGEDGWKFSLKGTDKKKILQLTGEEDLDTSSRRGSDFISYLNKQEDFTLLFQNGIAYRDGVYWKDNRFVDTFKKTETAILWSKVDIKKEVGTPKDRKQISITERVKQHLLKQKGPNKPLYLIDDNGANEVSDIIAITATKLILIHIKFSSKEDPGLRIDDLQVVCAQALKNLRFFVPETLILRIERFVDNRIFFPRRIPIDIERKLKNEISNIQRAKECWIIQPGISRQKLNNSPKDKAHTLLNYVDGICTSNNAEFRFFSSP